MLSIKQVKTLKLVLSYRSEIKDWKDDTCTIARGTLQSEIVDR